MKKRGRDERRGRVFGFDTHAVCLHIQRAAFTWLYHMGSYSATHICEIIDARVS